MFTEDSQLLLDDDGSKTVDLVDYQPAKDYDEFDPSASDSLYNFLSDNGFNEIINFSNFKKFIAKINIYVAHPSRDIYGEDQIEDTEILYDLIFLEDFDVTLVSYDLDEDSFTDDNLKNFVKQNIDKVIQLLLKDFRSSLLYTYGEEQDISEFNKIFGTNYDSDLNEDSQLLLDDNDTKKQKYIGDIAKGYLVALKDSIDDADFTNLDLKFNGKVYKNNYDFSTKVKNISVVNFQQNDDNHPLVATGDLFITVDDIDNDVFSSDSNLDILTQRIVKNCSYLLKNIHKNDQFKKYVDLDLDEKNYEIEKTSTSHGNNNTNAIIIHLSDVIVYIDEIQMNEDDVRLVDLFG